MLLMRDLGDDHKISVRGLIETAEALDQLVANVRNKVVWRTYNEKPSKPGKAAIVNAVLLWLHHQPVGEQLRITREGMAMLDRFMESDTPWGEEDLPGGETKDISPPSERKEGRKGAS